MRWGIVPVVLETAASPLPPLLQRPGDPNAGEGCAPICAPETTPGTRATQAALRQVSEAGVASSSTESLSHLREPHLECFILLPTLPTLSLPAVRDRSRPVHSLSL